MSSGSSIAMGTEASTRGSANLGVGFMTMFRVYDLGFMVYDVGRRVCDFGFRVEAISWPWLEPFTG